MNCNCLRVDRDCLKCIDAVRFCSLENEFEKKADAILQTIESIVGLVKEGRVLQNRARGRLKIGHSKRKPYWYKGLIA